MFIPDGFGTIFPYMFVPNITECVNFLIKAFGAIEMHKTIGPNGKIVNTHVKVGLTMFMVSQASSQYPPMPSAYYIFVENADKTLELAINCGATLEMSVSDMPYE